MSTPVAVEDMSYNILQDSQLRQRKLYPGVSIFTSGGLSGMPHGSQSTVHTGFGSSITDSHLEMRKELKERGPGAASLSVGAVMEGVRLSEEKISVPGSSGKRETISEAPSMSDMKHGCSSSVLFAQLDAAHQQGNDASLAVGVNSSPITLSGAHSVDLKSHLIGAARSVTTTPHWKGTFKTHSAIWTTEGEGLAAPHHLVETSHRPHTSETSQMTNILSPRSTTGVTQPQKSNHATPTSKTVHTQAVGLRSTATHASQLRKAGTPTTNAILQTSSKEAASSPQRTGVARDDLQMKSKSRAHDILADQVYIKLIYV